MAYASKEKKVKIHAALKLAIPATWKWSLAVRHLSTFVLTISSAPVNLVAINNDRRQLNEHYFQEHLKHAPKEVIDIMTKVMAAMNIDNFDESDSQSDYFHVGHYVNVNFGKWDKPFVCTATTATA